MNHFQCIKEIPIGLKRWRERKQSVLDSVQELGQSTKYVLNSE